MLDFWFFTDHSEHWDKQRPLVYFSLLRVQLETLAWAEAPTGLLATKLTTMLAVICYVLLGWRMSVVLPPLILPQSPKTCKVLRRLWCPRDKTCSSSPQRCTSKLPKQPCTSARSDVSVCGEDKLGSDWHYLPTFPQFVFLCLPRWFPHSKTWLSCGSLDDLHSVFFIPLIRIVTKTRSRYDLSHKTTRKVTRQAKINGAACTATFLPQK